jgi:hypothetical protein
MSQIGHEQKSFRCFVAAFLVPLVLETIWCFLTHRFSFLATDTNNWVVIAAVLVIGGVFLAMATTRRILWLLIYIPVMIVIYVIYGILFASIVLKESL